MPKPSLRLGYLANALSEGKAGLLLLGGQLDIGRQTNRLESTDDVPSQVELPPLHAVACGAGHPVVIVVPAKAECACIFIHGSMHLYRVRVPAVEYVPALKIETAIRATTKTADHGM